MTEKGKQVNAIREENRLHQQDNRMDQIASDYLRQTGLRPLTARQMRRVRENCDGKGPGCVRSSIKMLQFAIDSEQKKDFVLADPAYWRDKRVLDLRSRSFAEQNNVKELTPEEKEKIMRVCGGGRDYEASCFEQHLRQIRNIKMDNGKYLSWVSK
jgi:hypothetical protein